MELELFPDLFMNRQPATAAALVAILASFAFLYHAVIAKLVYDWANDGNYSHGFLVVPLAVYFAWLHRVRLAQAPRRPSLWGLAVVIGSVAMLYAGILGAELFLTRLSMIGVVFGALWFVYGRTHLRILAFPVGFLLLMIPIPAIIFNQIAFPLQLLASRVGEAALSALDIPVLREGNVIVLANISLEVAEACSGLRSLITLLTVGIVYGYFSSSTPAARVALAAATIPLAIAANGFRVAGTGVAAYYYGPSAAEGFFHTFSGWLVFVVTFAGLVAVHRLMQWVVPRRHPVRSATAAAA